MNDSAVQNRLNTIKSYLKYMDELTEAQSDFAYMVGMLAALIIINKDRFERFPEESHRWFYTVLGPKKGEYAFHIYWDYLRQYKESNY